jgi:hypothetical protein
MRGQRQRKGKKRQSIVDFETPTRPTRSVEQYTFVNQEEEKEKRDEGERVRERNQIKSNAPLSTLAPRTALHPWPARSSPRLPRISPTTHRVVVIRPFVSHSFSSGR